MRSCILILGLLSCSVNALADWQAKAVRDPETDLSQFSLRTSDEFPVLTLSCISVDASPIDMLQIDRLTRTKFDVIEEIEIQVDRNSKMIFYPDEHRFNIGYTYHQQLESGIETVTMMPANDSGIIQFAELVRQFIKGFSGVAWVKSAKNKTRVEFSLVGFTKAYLSMRTACLEYGDIRVPSAN